MKVFLSYALSPYDSALSARLRAVALAYNLELILPNADDRQNNVSNNIQKIKDCDAVIVLISELQSGIYDGNAFQYQNYDIEIQSVNTELNEAIRLNKPIIALVEKPGLITGLPESQIIIFNRQNPVEHESLLFQALKSIESNKNTADLLKALGALGLVALGFLALNEFTKDGK